jgi:DNA-binding NarL/FixJ family response regulator
MMKNPKIRLMSVGPRSAESRAFEGFLDQQSDIAVVGTCTELQKLASVAWSCVPHVMLMYLRGTQLAMDAVRNVLAELPEARLLLIVPSCPDQQAMEIIESGAWGSIEFGDLGKHGLLAIRTIWAGEIWGSRKVLSRIVQANVRHATEQITLSKAMQALTGRESEIVKLLQTGSSNKEIAARLAISDQTVKTHVHNIFSKLNVSRRNKIFPKLFS